MFEKESEENKLCLFVFYYENIIIFFFTLLVCSIKKITVKNKMIILVLK